MANEYEGYPKEIDQCPVCGSTKQVMRDLVVPEVAKGNWPPNFEGFTDRKTMLLRNPSSIKLLGGSIPAIDIMFDVCGNCGTQYAKKMNVVQIPVEAVINSGQGIARAR